MISPANILASTEVQNGLFLGQVGYKTSAAALLSVGSVDSTAVGGVVAALCLSLVQVRKTFLTLSYCDHCKHLLFQGYKCQMCSSRYHVRCANEHGSERCVAGHNADDGYYDREATLWCVTSWDYCSMVLAALWFVTSLIFFIFSPSKQLQYKTDIYQKGRLRCDSFSGCIFFSEKCYNFLQVVLSNRHLRSHTHPIRCQVVDEKSDDTGCS